MPRQVTLLFDTGDRLTTRSAWLLNSSPTAISVRLDEVPDWAPGSESRPELPDLPNDGDTAIVAVVHGPVGGAGTGFVLTTRLKNTAAEPGVLHLARSRSAP